LGSLDFFLGSRRDKKIGLKYLNKSLARKIKCFPCCNVDI